MKPTRSQHYPIALPTDSTVDIVLNAHSSALASNERRVKRETHHLPRVDVFLPVVADTADGQIADWVVVALRNRLKTAELLTAMHQVGDVERGMQRTVRQEREIGVVSADFECVEQVPPTALEIASHPELERSINEQHTRARVTAAAHSRRATHRNTRAESAETVFLFLFQARLICKNNKQFLNNQQIKNQALAKSRLYMQPFRQTEKLWNHSETQFRQKIAS